MYKEHSEIKTPNRDIVIWRYLSLDKFLFMLNEEKLYFARQDCFFDSFEGRLSNEDIAFYDKVIPDISKLIINDIAVH